MFGNFSHFASPSAFVFVASPLPLFVFAGKTERKNKEENRGT